MRRIEIDAPDVIWSYHALLKYSNGQKKRSCLEFTMCVGYECLLQQ